MKRAEFRKKIQEVLMTVEWYRSGGLTCLIINRVFNRHWLLTVDTHPRTDHCEDYANIFNPHNGSTTWLSDHTMSDEEMQKRRSIAILLFEQIALDEKLYERY